jgi:HlyD family secretion protein
LVELVAPASEVVIEVKVERGMHIEAGDLVARLDPTIMHAEVAGAEAALASARTNAAVAKQDLQRARNLREQGVTSQQDRERAELAADEAEARLREAEARLAVAKKRLRDMTILAPAAGIVDQIPFDVGERVPGGAVLAVVLQDGPPWVRVWIPERAVSRVRPGMAAVVSIDGVGTRIRGRVLDVAREPEFTPHFALTERERAHLVYETRVLIEDPPAPLRPGLPAEVLIRLPAPAGGDA